MLDTPGSRKHAVILAGGRGTRLRPYTTTIPKPLVPIGENHSILEIVMRQLASEGFTGATLAIGHLGQLVRAYVGDGSQWGLSVDYATEEKPLGTIGPILQLLEHLPENFLIMNGDVLTDLPFGRMLDEHVRSESCLTIATYQREVKIDFGVLSINNSRVEEFTEKPTIHYSVSMGVYAVAREVLERYPPGEPFGFDDLVLDLLDRGLPPQSHAFDGYWLDIGRPDDYDRANAEFDSIKEKLLHE